MARIFIDGFEHGQNDLWDNNTSPAGISVVSAVEGMTGNYCLFHNTNDQYIEKFVSAKDEYYVAFKYKPNTNQARLLFQFFNGTNGLGGLRRRKNDDGDPLYVLEAYKGKHASGSVILAQGSTQLVTGTAYLIEIRYKPHDSTGVFQVKLNGVLEIDFSGDTTNYAGQIDRIRIGDTSNWSYGYGYYDDLVLDDAGWIGNTKIQAIGPSAAGNSAQFDPSAGSNWECVDEVPPSDDDFNSTNVNDEVDLFTFGDLAGSIEEVKCVQVQARAAYEGSPTPTKLQLGVRRSSTNYFSASKDLTTSLKQHCHIWEQDPSTSSAWAKSGVDAAEFGYKAVSA